MATDNLVDRLGPSPFAFVTPRDSIDSALDGNLLQEPLKPYVNPEVAPVSAYAKLESTNFTYFLRKLQIMIGRKVSPNDPVDVHLGNVKSVSRQHARIQYNFMTQAFELAIYGKNGAWIDDVQIPCNSRPIALRHGSKIRIGDIDMFFILPRLDQHAEMSIEMPDMKPARDLAPTSVQGGVVKKQKIGRQDYYPTGTIVYQAQQEARERRRPGARGSIVGSQLPNGETPQRPPLSYAALISEAINSTPEGRITLKDMYVYISTHYPFYGMDSHGWQNCLRHTLSLHKAFVKSRRSDKGKGAYWSIDPAHQHTINIGVRPRMRTYVSEPPQTELMALAADAPQVNHQIHHQSLSYPGTNATQNGQSLVESPGRYETEDEDSKINIHEVGSADAGGQA